jgi:hypothetical protein
MEIFILVFVIVIVIGNLFLAGLAITLHHEYTEILQREEKTIKLCNDLMATMKNIFILSNKIEKEFAQFKKSKVKK